MCPFVFAAVCVGLSEPGEPRGPGADGEAEEGTRGGSEEDQQVAGRTKVKCPIIPL